MYIESIHLTGASTPQIDAWAKANAEYILWRPVNEVQVEVVLEFWSIKHFERYARYLAHSLQHPASCYFMTNWKSFIFHLSPWVRMQSLTSNLAHNISL